MLVAMPDSDGSRLVQSSICLRIAPLFKVKWILQYKSIIPAKPLYRLSNEELKILDLVQSKN